MCGYGNLRCAAISLYDVYWLLMSFFTYVHLIRCHHKILMDWNHCREQGIFLKWVIWFHQNMFWRGYLARQYVNCSSNTLCNAEHQGWKLPSCWLGPCSGLHVRCAKEQCIILIDMSRIAYPTFRLSLFWQHDHGWTLILQKRNIVSDIVLVYQRPTDWP